MTRISVGDVTYYIERHGPLYETANGPRPLLLLHGFSGCAANWSSLASTILAREGDYVQRRVIAVDALGHGQSDAPDDPARYAIERAVADLTAVLDTLGIERIDALGYSMGGRLALAFAILAPERVGALVLESASPGLRTPEARKARIAADMALADSIEREGVPAFVDRWERLPLFASQRRLPEDQREELRRQRLDNRATGLANSLRGMGTGAQPSFWERLPTLNAPTLLITGEDDPKFRAIAQEMYALFPNGRTSNAPSPFEVELALCMDDESRGHNRGTQLPSATTGGAHLDRSPSRLGSDSGTPGSCEPPGDESVQPRSRPHGFGPRYTLARGHQGIWKPGSRSKPFRIGYPLVGVQSHRASEQAVVMPFPEQSDPLSTERHSGDRQTHRWCVVAGAGHAVHLEQPQRFADLVRLFLEEGSQ